jgi:predicted nucleotidyltransferase
VTKSGALEKLIARAKEDEAVLAVMLFGSQARGEATSASDVDVCLVLQPQAAERKGEKRVEYLSEFDLDVQVFQALPLPIRRRVLKEGRVLHVKDEDALYALAFRTAQEFDDLRHIYEAYLEAVADGGS